MKPSILYQPLESVRQASTCLHTAMLRSQSALALKINDLMRELEHIESALEDLVEEEGAR